MMDPTQAAADEFVAQAAGWCQDVERFPEDRSIRSAEDRTRAVVAAYLRARRCDHSDPCHIDQVLQLLLAELEQDPQLPAANPIHQ